jgi:hypothetical protein
MFLPGHMPLGIRRSYAPPADILGASCKGAYSFSRKMANAYVANAGAFFHLTGSVVDTLYNQVAAQNFTAAAGLRPGMANVGPRNRAAVQFTGATVYLTGPTASVLFNVGVGYFIGTVVITAIAANAHTFSAPAIMADSNEYLGIFVDGTTSQRAIFSYQYDGTSAVGNYTTSTSFLPFGGFGAPLVVEWWHALGQFGCNVNGVESVGASPNGFVTGTVFLGAGGVAYMTGYMFEAIFANAMPTAAQRAYLRENLLSWIS